MKKILYFSSVVLCLVVFVVFSMLQRTVPKKHGDQEFLQLKYKVNVFYDKYGIPHIESEDDDDAYRALGFVMASDRIFQMDLMRRLVNGTLSEIFGKKMVKVDTMLRKLRFKKSADMMYEKYKDNVNQKAFSQASAFLEGVHHFMESRPLPVEFYLLDYRPEPFTLSDIIGLAGYMSLTFAEGINGDVLFSELMQKLPEDKMDIISVGAGVDTHYFPDQKIVKSKLLKSMNDVLSRLEEVLPLFHGSNSWVLSGRRTNTGYPILANDPHIGVKNPHIFYEAHLKTPNLELYGHFLPLSPFATIGHTPQTAWGFTMAEVDDLNIYEEKINPEDPSQVMFKNEWVSLEKYSERIKVKDADDVFVEVKVTPHGPLLEGTRFGVEGKNLALHWSVYHPDNNVVQTLFALPYAKTIDEFKFALSHAGAPGLNVTWASKAGDIAWWIMGKFPKLPEGTRTDMILKGWDGTQEVERYYTIDENPHVINPESGVIVSANYRPQQPEFAHFDGYWQPSGRFFRISKLLSEKATWSLEELKKIQLDDIIPIASQLKGELLKVIDVGNLTKLEKEAYELLKNWDGKSDIKSVGSSIYHMWNYFLVYNIFIDELGEEDFVKFGQSADFWHAYKKLVFDHNHSFWDDIRTDRVERGEQVINKAFKQSVADLKDQLGIHLKNWTWGKLHTVEYEHPIGQQKPLNFIFNIGPIAANGGRYVINNLGHKKYLKDFRVVHAPATRRLISLENTKASFGILPTGNSGNPFSEHFKDQLHLYHAGKYRQQIMDMSVFSQVKPLVLRPKK